MKCTFYTENEMNFLNDHQKYYNKVENLLKTYSCFININVDHWVEIEKDWYKEERSNRTKTQN